MKLSTTFANEACIAALEKDLSNKFTIKDNAHTDLLSCPKDTCGDATKCKEQKDKYNG